MPIFLNIAKSTTRLAYIDEFFLLLWLPVLPHLFLHYQQKLDSQSPYSKQFAREPGPAQAGSFLSKYSMATLIVQGMNFTNSQYGEVERQIVEIVRKHVEAKTDTKTYLLYLTTFFNHERFMQIKNSLADVVLLFNGTDAIDPELYWIMKSPAWHELLIDKEVRFIGSDFANEVTCDFWAAVTNQYFKQYTEQEIQPGDITKIFLNYNRKPNWIRRGLLEAYVYHNVDHLGHITLGINTTKNPDLDRFVLPTEVLDHATGGEGDALVDEHYTLKDLRVANDIFSLGNLDIWNSCFLNVVTETAVSDTLWCSEKLFKPLIGMRPFFYYGNPRVLYRLEQLGFDIFRDVNQIDDSWFNAIQCQEYHATGEELEILSDKLIAVVNNLKPQNLNKLYQDLYPRLKHNRGLFLKYSADALWTFENNLNDYLRTNQ